MKFYHYRSAQCSHAYCSSLTEIFLNLALLANVVNGAGFIDGTSPGPVA